MFYKRFFKRHIIDASEEIYTTALPGYNNKLKCNNNKLKIDLNY